MSSVEKAKEVTKKYFEDKFSSPFWVTYIVSWCLWNWKVWYVTFFVDSEMLLENYNLLKMDYITSLYKGDSFWTVLWIICHLIVLPFLSACFIVFIMPKITFRFYEKSSNDEFREKELDIEKDKKLLQIKESKLKIAKNIKKTEEEIEENRTQEEIWDDEYEEFKKTGYFAKFEDVKNCIFESSGYVKSSTFGVPTDINAYFNSNNIVEFTDKNFESITLTQKGKYFLRKYMDDTDI